MPALPFKKAFAVAFLLAAALLFASLLSAWTGPTATAPSGNVAAPINVGTTDQVKDAGISVNSFAVFGSQYVQDALGIGRENPIVALDINGTLRLADGEEVCQSITEGAQRYNTSSNVMEFCDGTSWGSLGGGGVPAGGVVPVMMASCPAGYMAANGSEVSRSTYSTLYSAIGVMYGAGDGSTTFTLPDLRGYFLRGWANGSSVDPDRASRTNRGDGTTGDAVGTKQADQFGSHAHGFTDDTVGLYAGTGESYGPISLPNSTSAADTTTAAGGNETRPENISVLYCIKY